MYIRNLSIALVSDFYYPSLGGVEQQIKELAKYLKNRARNVIVITHCRPDYYGPIFIEGVKTYYLPWHYSATGSIYPSFFLQYPEAKQILIAENINIVHTHQSSSCLAACYGIFAYHMRIKIVHTQHSLFGLRTLTDLHFVWAATAVYELYNKFICVSRTTRNNFILRCHTDSKNTIVIPNAVPIPCIQAQKSNKQSCVKIIMVSRLVYRRGIDLFLQVLPILCERNQQLMVQIVGEGPKLEPLKWLIKKYGLQSQVKLHGGQPNDITLRLVKQCDIFLSTALTQSFGIALVEASYLGLHCVSTNVGGVSEILPDNKLHMVQLNANSITYKLEQLIGIVKIKRSQNQVLKQSQIQYYKNEDCYERVIDVYQQISIHQHQNKLPKLIRNVVFTGSLPSLLTIIGLIIYQIIDILIDIRKYLKF